MRKIIFALICVFVGAGLSAANQITRINPNKGVGFKIGSSLSLYITVNGSSLLPAGISEFGYYTIDKNGNPLNGSYSGGVIDTAQLAATGAVQLGDFNRGDIIAFWMKDVNGNYLDSYYRGVKGKDRYAVYEGNNGKNNTSVSMGYIDCRPGWAPSAGVGTLSFNVVVGKVPSSGGGHKPTGMPLPGVLSTLVVGGTLSAYMMKRRRGRRQ